MATARPLIDELSELAAGVRRWHTQTPLGSIEISLNGCGVLTALFQEFRRSRNPSLRAALAEATVRPHQYPLLTLIATVLEGESPSPAAHVPGARHR